MNFKYLTILLLIILLVLLSFLIPQFCVKKKIILGGLWDHITGKDEAIDYILAPILIEEDNANTSYYFEEFKKEILKKIKKINNNQNVAIFDIFQNCYSEIKSKLDAANIKAQSKGKIAIQTNPNFGLFLLILGMVIKNDSEFGSFDFLSLQLLSHNSEEKLDSEENFIKFRELLATKYIKVITSINNRLVYLKSNDNIIARFKLEHIIYTYYIDALDENIINWLNWSYMEIKKKYQDIIINLKNNIDDEIEFGYSSDNDVFPINEEVVFPINEEVVFPIKEDEMTMLEFCSKLQILFRENKIIDTHPCKSGIFLNFIDLYIPNFKLKAKQIFDNLISNNKLNHSTIQQFLPPYLIKNTFLMSYIFIKYICILFLQTYEIITKETSVSFDMGHFIIDKGETILLNIIYTNKNVFICMLIMTTNMPTILSTIYHSFWNKSVFRLKVIKFEEVESLRPPSTLEYRLAKYNISSLPSTPGNTAIINIFDKDNHLNIV